MSETQCEHSRFGVYFAPMPHTLLHRLGNKWLGRDADSGDVLDPELPSSLTESEWRQATESPRRYGFHATLKPPFTLAEGATVSDLRAAVKAFAASRSRFEAGPLAVSTLGRFLALTLLSPPEELSKFAADCVCEFDCLRRPPAAEEQQSRLTSFLSEHERDYVLRWGYPYVFDTWKFHMTLTSSLSAEMRARIEPHLHDRFAVICREPLVFDSVCIFQAAEAQAPFRVIERALLGGA